MSISPSACELAALQQRIVACTRCPRLIKHCREVARVKRRMYRDWDYWGRPVPSFGDPNAEVLILGLAPAAHGANRTGRMFTGDRSGEFLYRALSEAGFANQPDSSHRADGLELRNCYITAALRCAPPKNRPLPKELSNCQPFLEQEFALLIHVRAVLVLGRIAFDTYLRLIYSRVSNSPPGRNALPKRSTLRFGHGASFQLPGSLPRLFCSYHPSQQNTQTGKLTQGMLRQVLEEIQAFLGS